MKRFSRSFNFIVSLIVVISMCLTSFQQAGAGSPPSSPKSDAGVRYATNHQTGMLSFIGADPQAPLVVAEAARAGAKPGESALAMVDHFKARLGLKDVYQELKLEKFSEVGSRQVSRYQQIYQGIPVMAGELMVNATSDGRMLSISGEIAPGLALNSTPAIEAAQASQIALNAIAKGYQLDLSQLKSSQPALWVYDSRLLKPDGSAPALVWRMEVRSADGRKPINELVLVNAQRGNIALNFNQVDTAWVGGKTNPSLPAQASLSTAVTSGPKTGSGSKALSARYAAFGAGNWFVTTSGNDSNSCAEPALPCLTINGALAKTVASGDTINVAAGTYTGTGAEVVLVNKSVSLVGGWNELFETQNGYSIIDGGNTRVGVRIITPGLVVSLSRFVIQHANVFGLYVSGSGLAVQVDETIFRLNFNGIYHNGGVLSFTRVGVINNTGEGIYNLAGDVTFTNSTVSGNQQASSGSVIINITGKISVQNSTITNNGGSYAVYAANVSALIEIGNSILAGNGEWDCFGNIQSVGNNIFGQTPPCRITVSIQPSDQTGVNPDLGPLLPGGYHPLLLGSPAIGAANPASCQAVDQRGIARPQGAGCDIGAYEYAIPGAAASLFVQSGSNQRAGPTYSYAQPFKVWPLDSQDSPVPGVDVTFTAPASGASGIFADTGAATSSVISDPNGLAASPVFFANGLSGAYTVTVSADSVPSASIDLENTGYWYVSTSGSDANTCSAPDAACLTINAAVGKASADDVIRVAAGTYTGSGTQVVLVNKNMNLSGGWDVGFSIRSGISTIDGQGARGGFNIDCFRVNLDRFNITNGANSGGVTNCGDLTISNSTIQNNSSTQYYGGGGIYNYIGSLTLNNVTVSQNTAQNSGAGIYINSGKVSLNNATISANSSFASSGLFVNNTVGTMVWIQNSILAGNAGSECGGTIHSLGYNLLGSNSGCDFLKAAGDLVGSGSFHINPHLTPMQGNGSLALKTSSPAVNAGSPVVPGSTINACLKTDQDGTLRPVDGRCDIGAVEGAVMWPFVPLASTYSAYSSDTLPGYFLCDQSQPSCTGNSNPDADAAQRYALGVDNFYYTYNQRDSIDNNAMKIVSTVEYCDPASPCPYDNAFWDGSQMVYGAGYPKADDVVGHELTHGVTQYESGLFYYYQSGAINESLSDIWGELYDQSNGQGNDTAAVKWLMGEDISGGAIRSMSNPPAYSDPDAITSSLYFTGWQDNGGVHTNSGVNNKAAYLMVAGGTFNGKTVLAIGATKTLDVYYEAQTHLLTSGSDYLDLYNALYQACFNVLGVDGISFSDCQQVRTASDAVAMNAQPRVGIRYNPEAPFCDSSSTYRADTFYDDIENINGNWQFANWDALRWQYGSSYGEFAHSGKGFLYADDYPDYISDSNASLHAVTIPAKAYMHFSQAYGFEYGVYKNVNYYFDGGVLEYSSDAGNTWVDAGSLMINNGYNGKLFFGYNPLRGRSAFVGESHGYFSTRLNLSSLAGKSVSFRWRMGLDNTGYALGWFIDDVRVYTCQPLPVAPILVSPANANLSNNPVPTFNWGAVSGASSYQLEIATTSNFAAIVQNFSGGPGVVTYQAAPLPSGVYYWHVRSINGSGFAGLWSAYRLFTVDLTPPVSPVLALPVNAAAVFGTPLFTWKSSATAIRYQFAYDNDADFSSPIYTSGEVIGLKITPPAMPLGVYSWHVRARDAAGNWSTWSLPRLVTIHPPTPLAPVLSAPASALKTNDATPDFAWSGVAYGDTYQLEISNSNKFTIKLQSFSGAPGVLNYTAGLLSEGIYYWHVRAVNAASVAGPWSAIRSFTIDTTPPPAPVLSLPASGALLTGAPKFVWLASSSAVKYQFELGSDAGFTSLVYTSGELTGLSFTPPAQALGTYYWHVRAKDAAGNWGAWSLSRAISIH